MNSLFHSILILQSVLFFLEFAQADQEWGYLWPICVEGKYGYIDSEGSIRIKPAFLHAERFSEGLGSVKATNGLWGFINIGGEFEIDPSFKYAAPFSEEKAYVEFEDSQGYIDKKGRLLFKIPFKGTSFSEGRAKIFNSECLTGYINIKGEIIVKPKYQPASDFSEGLAAVSSNTWFVFFIDKDGNPVIKDTDNRSFGNWFPLGYREGLAAVWRYSPSRMVFINKDGKIEIDANFAWVGNFSEGLAWVWEGGDKKVGFINKEGILIIKPQFEHAWDFSEGMARVIVNEKVGFIDKGGKFAIEPQFDNAEDFYHGLAEIWLTRGMKNTKGYVNKKGLVVWENSWEEKGITVEFPDR